MKKSTKKCLCIIPARGGSKRIPKKNIKFFLGKPIIAYSIETAFQSGLFSEVMVSTDDLEIAEIAKEFGANIPFIRSPKNADDFATTVDVLLEVIGKYEKLDKFYDFACCLYPTAPFVTVEHINIGLNKLIKENRKTVFPAVKFSYPIWRGFSKKRSGYVDMIWPEYQNTRSQDLEEVYHDAGQWYWVDITELKKTKSLFTDNSCIVELNDSDVQDIDTLSDWELAIMKYKIKEKL